jgi:hypothetical protein
MIHCMRLSTDLFRTDARRYTRLLHSAPPQTKNLRNERTAPTPLALIFCLLWIYRPQRLSSGRQHQGYFFETFRFSGFLPLLLKSRFESNDFFMRWPKKIQMRLLMRRLIRRDRAHKQREYNGYLTTMDAFADKKSSFVSSSSSEMVWAMETCDFDLSFGK